MKKKVLDVTSYKCPMTFLKTKDFIKKNKNHTKVIIIKGKKDAQLLTNSLKKNFYVEILELKDKVYEITIKPY